MRYREPFTVYRRTLPTGKRIFYYQTYDENGRRTSSYSTGKVSKSTARAYCYELLKKGMLIPKKRGGITFEAYSENWWLWNECEYLIYRSKRRTISESYAKTARRTLEKHILPRFSRLPLKSITTYDIEKWQDSFKDKGLSNATAKLALAILRVMLNEAVRRNLIFSNPANSVKPLKNEHNETGILKAAEVEKLFNVSKKDKIWSDEIFYLGNLLSACTGMRIGEILAVRGESLKGNYILVDKQFTRHFGLTDTKSHSEREVVIPAELQKQLEKLENKNKGGYFFSQNGGHTPVNVDTMRRALHNALKKIGIDEEERRTRRVSFHSWRHYLNTTMRSNNIADGKLRAMVGHSSEQMTEHYTHFNPDDFKDIQKIQAKIINITKAG